LCHLKILYDGLPGSSDEYRPYRRGFR
jgi:hypothetical protein